MRLQIRNPKSQIRWILLSLLVAGCGSSGPDRYNVSGMVTYAGQPIPKGEIVFEPDPQRGNQGPQGRAPINGGKFASVEGRGVIAGPVIARVFAYDGKFNPESPNGSPLCRPYEFELELPAADSTHDLAVPASTPPRALR